MLNVFDLVNYALAGLMYFGVYSVLRRSSRAYMAFVVGLTLVGLSMSFASNQAFNLLSLSSQYIRGNLRESEIAHPRR